MTKKKQRSRLLIVATIVRVVDIALRILQHCHVI